jgi:hypothetical protein
MKNPRMPRPPQRGIGHNSVQIVANGFCPEDDWRRFERDEARRERFRLVKLGRIIPPFRTPPQMLVKVDGAWRAEIKLCQP